MFRECLASFAAYSCAPEAGHMWSFAYVEWQVQQWCANITISNQVKWIGERMERAICISYKVTTSAAEVFGLKCFKKISHGNKGRENDFCVAYMSHKVDL